MYWPPTLYLNRIKPDLIHLEEEPDSLVALETVVARQVFVPRARLVLFTWQNLLRRRKPIVQAITRYVLPRVDHFIAGNREAIGVLRDQGYTGAVSQLPQLGVDPDRFRRLPSDALKMDLGLNGFVVGYIGRLTHEKGVDLLIRAAHRVNQDENIQLLFVGRGPMRDRLEGLAEELGLQRFCTWIGPVPHHEIPLYLSAMDALVLPSRTTTSWKEQFGHVLIEAMACGTPVIASDSGAIPEVVSDAGLIFPEEDVQSLSAHLLRVLRDSALKRQLRQRGRQRVIENFSHRQIAVQTAQIYQSVMSANRSDRN